MIPPGILSPHAYPRKTKLSEHPAAIVECALPYAPGINNRIQFIYSRRGHYPRPGTGCFAPGPLSGSRILPGADSGFASRFFPAFGQESLRLLIDQRQHRGLFLVHV